MSMISIGLAAAQSKAVSDAEGSDGIGLERFDILSPLGNLRAQIVLNFQSDGIGFAGDVSAERLGLVVAGPAAEIDLEGRCAGERHADFKREGPMALARDGVSPAGGDGEGRARGVHVEQSIAVDRSCAGGRVGGGRVVGLVVKREAGAARHRCVGGYLVAVVEEETRTDSKTFTERVNVDSGTGGLHGKTGVGADPAGGEVGGVVEDVAGGSQVEVRVKVGGH